MLAVSLLKWWYSQGWLEALRHVKVKLKRTYLSFSVPVLLRTLAMPWRQLVAPKDPNATIGVNIRRLIDNLVSRFVGFWVRVLTILTALVMITLFALTGLVLILLWPIIPIAVIWLLIKGVGIL